MSLPEYRVELEVAPGSWANISHDVKAVDFQRQLTDVFHPMQPGDVMVVLDNDDGRYSPESSSLSLRPNLQLRVGASYEGVSYGVFAGQVDFFNIAPSLEAGRLCSVRASDRGKALEETILDLPLRTDIDVGSLAVEVLSYAGLSSMMAVDALTDVVPYAWFKDRNARNALQDLVDFGFYHAYVDGSGRMNVRSRYFNIQGSVVVSFSGATNDGYFDLSYSLNDEHIFNKVKVEAQPRVKQADVSTIAYISEVLTIPGSGHVGFFLEYRDPSNNQPAPAADMVAPVATTDFLFNTASGGGGTDLTATGSASVVFFGASAVCTLFNGDARTAYVNKFQLRGQSLQQQPRIAADFSHASSQALYGQKDFTLTNNFIASRPYADAYAQYIGYAFADPEPDLVLSVRNEFPFIFAVELGDLINLEDPNTGIDDRYTVVSLEHTVSLEGGAQHDLSLSLQRFRDQEALILDDPAFGKLDERRLGF